MRSCDVQARRGEEEGDVEEELWPRYSGNGVRKTFPRRRIRKLTNETGWAGAEARGKRTTDERALVVVVTVMGWGEAEGKA